MRLNGKTVIITGAARGLGRACALRFAEEGADLMLMDIGKNLKEVPYDLGSESQLEYTAQLCREFGTTIITMIADVRSSEQLEKVAMATLARFGKIDVLLNNAGIALPSGKIVHEITEEEWDTMLNIDLSGTWRMTKAVGKIMSDQRSGSIINIASTAGTVGYRHFSGYVAAKHGVIGLTKAAAMDYAPLKVRVNALCPGSVRDDKFHEGIMLSEIARCLEVNIAAHEEIFIQAQPMNELIEPKDIADAATWLASDESVRVTGSVITIDAGFTAK
jgi:NAD(P)-dependent dehydrogenase (short-subunit alcohol dehydrogenase family)